MKQSPLGSEVEYADTYTPSLLHPIARADSRPSEVSHFFGEDLWHAYEFTWLNSRGKPQVAVLRIRVPCTSSHIIESKSMKLYLNSYTQTRFAEPREVRSTLESDLKVAVRAPVDVQMLTAEQLAEAPARLPGTCLDALDVAIEHYRPKPDLLAYASDAVTREVVYSHLFRSVCPVTGQPDWATIWIEYLGRELARESILEYLISYRRHEAFHEATVEQIFTELMTRCAPQELTVMGLFLRRGGVDINPYRSTQSGPAPVYRLPRQ